MKQSSNGKFNLKFHVYFVIYFAPRSQAEHCSADNGKTRLYIDISGGDRVPSVQGQKDFAVILAKNRGTATSQTRLIRG